MTYSTPEIEIRNRNGWLYAVIRKQRGLGRALVRRLGTKDMTEAKALIKDSGLLLMAQAAKADLIGQDVFTRLLAGKKVTLQSAVDAYETHCHNIGQALGSIIAKTDEYTRFIRETRLGDKPLSFIETKHIASWVNRSGALSLTRRQWILTVHQGFYRYCMDQRWIVRSPCLDVVVRIDKLTQEQLIPKTREPFTDEEVKIMLEKIPRSDFWHGAILLSYHYGLRIETVINLEDTNIVGNRLRVYARKGKREVNEELNDEIKSWLEHWRLHRPPSEFPYLFPDQAIAGAKSASNGFRYQLAKLGIKGKSFAGLRKTATARRWSRELDELGPEDKRRLMRLIAEKGFKNVQQMLSHAPGSDVTDKHYMPR